MCVAVLALPHLKPQLLVHLVLPGYYSECSIANRSGDDSSLSMYGTSLLVFHSSYRQTITDGRIANRTKLYSPRQAERRKRQKFCFMADVWQFPFANSSSKDYAHDMPGCV